MGLKLLMSLTQQNRISQNLREIYDLVILGVANERSIAWGITKAMKAQGASVA